MKVAAGWLSRRTLVLSAATLVALTLGLARPAHADEQRVSRLGLAISAMATSLTPDDLNDAIIDANRTADEFGIRNLDEIQASAFFQTEARFFISDKLVATMGFGRIRRTSEVNLVPQRDSEIIVLGRITGVPRHLGLNYYFAPYTSGDFTVRPFAGGGIMDIVEAKLKVGGEFRQADTLVFGAFDRGRGEGAGFFLEGGAHLMLPSRYSFIVNLHYRHLKVDQLIAEDAFSRPMGVLLKANGEPAELDFSGFGLRIALNVDILNRF